MALLIVAVIASATLAFGAVYPWGYIPLFSAAAAIGAAGIALRREPVFRNRLLGIALLVLIFAVGMQVVPLRRAAIETVSPQMPELLGQYKLRFTGDLSHSLSVEAANTVVALAGLSALGLYLMGCFPMFSRDALRALPRNLMLFAAPLAVFGILSRELNNGLVYWFWKPHQGGGSDAFGPFVNRNHFAGWMLMASCLVIGALLGQIERARVPRGSGWRSRAVWLSSPEFNGVLMMAASVALMVLSLVWTLSRSAIGGFVVALCGFAWLTVRRSHVSRVYRASVVLSLAVLFIASLWWRGAATVIAWFEDPQDLNGRIAAWSDGWHVIRDFPLVGTGLGTYSTAMLFYQRSNPGFHLNEAHNDYLQLLAEGGLLVAIPASIVVVYLAVAVRSNLVAARHEARGYWIRAGAAIGLVAIGVQELVEFSLQIPANAFLFCTLAAVALAPVHDKGAADESRRQ